MSVSVQVRYFAALREALGEGEAVSLPSGSTVGDVRRHLMACDARHAQALDLGRAVRCALNHTLCQESAPLVEGAEVAFFPPVTGG
ncbi:MAG: molybdopterin converting factor subunit 1 [Pseudomonadota bacterium]